MEVSGQLQAFSLFPRAKLQVIFETAELLNNEFRDIDESGHGVTEGYIALWMQQWHNTKTAYLELMLRLS